MRKRAGRWLQELRKEAGLTQADLGSRMDHSYTSSVSQIERGKARVPPEHWRTWAELLRKDPQWFAERMLYWYDPHAYHEIFGGIHPQDAEGLPREASTHQRIRGTRAVA